MSKADKIFVNMCNDIIENGFSDEGQEVRAKMGGRHSGSYNKKILCGKQIRFIRGISDIDSKTDISEKCD